MAQTPKMMDFELRKSLQSSKESLRTERLDPYFESLESSVNAKSEYEQVEDGEGDLVATELEAILNAVDLLWSIPLVQVIYSLRAYIVNTKNKIRRQRNSF